MPRLSHVWHYRRSEARSSVGPSIETQHQAAGHMAAFRSLRPRLKWVETRTSGVLFVSHLFDRYSGHRPGEKRPAVAGTPLWRRSSSSRFLMVRTTQVIEELLLVREAWGRAVSNASPSLGHRSHRAITELPQPFIEERDIAIAVVRSHYATLLTWGSHQAVGGESKLAVEAPSDAPTKPAEDRDMSLSCP
jgi:hypothetical protein